MPKIIALLAGISVVLIFAAYRLFGVSRPAENTLNTSAVPAITSAAQPAPTTSGASTAGTSGMPTASDPTVISAKPGQIRQFDSFLDADPDGTYPPVTGNARFNAFEKYKPPTEQRLTVKPPPPSSRNNFTKVDGAGLPGGGFNSSGVTMSPGNTLTVIPKVDNTPQQEITLDGVVTGSDGFAVLTIREPSRQNSMIPEQKRFVRLGDAVGNAKIIEISEVGLKLSQTEGTWSVGDKRGVTRRGMVVAFTLPSERTPAPAMDAKLPLLSLP